MTATLILARGLPAAGKTSWAVDYIGAHPTTVRANRDDLRRTLHDGRFSKSNEKTVTMVQEAIIVSALSAGRDCLVDDTNLNPRVVRRLEQLAADHGARVEWQDFTHVPLRECIKRDAKRERSVGENTIREMWERYLMPAPRERTGRPACVLVDLDGTLALMGSGRGPFQWERVGEDSPNELVVALVRNIGQDGGWLNAEVVVVSGRDGSCRDLTEKWLAEHDIRYEALFMRPAGDTRHDWQVKSEILERDILVRWDPILAVDDRQQVCDFWRGAGLQVWQVAPGRF